jgi:hypothetical protein
MWVSEHGNIGTQRLAGGPGQWVAVLSETCTCRLGSSQKLFTLAGKTGVRWKTCAHGCLMSINTYRAFRSRQVRSSGGQSSFKTLMQKHDVVGYSMRRVYTNDLAVGRLDILNQKTVRDQG